MHAAVVAAQPRPDKGAHRRISAGPDRFRWSLRDRQLGDLRQIPFLVLGCGVAGLAAAKVLAQSGVPFLALDREDGPGGLVRTDQVRGYRFDRAGHFIHARSAEFQRVLEDSGIQMAHFERKSAVLFDGRVIPYPVQFNLWACDRSFSSAVTQEIEQPCVPTDSGLRQTLLGTWGSHAHRTFLPPLSREDVGARAGRYSIRLGLSLRAEDGCSAGRARKLNADRQLWL